MKTKTINITDLIELIENDSVDSVRDNTIDNTDITVEDLMIFISNDPEFVDYNKHFVLDCFNSMTNLS